MSPKNRVSLRLALYVYLMWGGIMGAFAGTGPNADYAYFSALSDVGAVQVRLTYVGWMQDEDLPPIILTTTGNPADGLKFVPFENPSILYPIPEVGSMINEISSAQMQQLISNAGSIAAVNSDSTASSPWLSFAMCDSSGDTTMVSEAVLDKPDSAVLFQQIANAIVDDAEAFATIMQMACNIGGLVPDRPTDVSDSISVEKSGVRLDRESNAFVSVVTLTNTSDSAIDGPMSLALDFREGGVALKNPTGVTCGTSPKGLHFIDVPLDGNVLPAGESVEVRLLYENPNRVSVEAATKVMAGPGAR